MIAVIDKQQALEKGTEIIKLANAWLEQKNLPLYFSVVMTTCFIGKSPSQYINKSTLLYVVLLFTVTEFKYSSEDQLPEKITGAKSNAINLLKASMNLKDGEQVPDTVAIDVKEAVVDQATVNGQIESENTSTLQDSSAIIN